MKFWFGIFMGHGIIWITLLSIRGKKAYNDNSPFGVNFFILIINLSD